MPPESIDWPVPPPPRRRRRRFIIVLVILAVILFSARTALSYYIDVLWFGSLGYGEVFWKTLSLQWGIFAAFAAATFLILYGTFLALKRAHLPDLPSGHTIFIGGQPVKLPVEPVLRIIALGISLVIAAATGASIMSDWATLALYWNASPIAGGVVDPIFGQAAEFFSFYSAGVATDLGLAAYASRSSPVRSPFSSSLLRADRACSRGVSAAP